MSNFKGRHLEPEISALNSFFLKSSQLYRFCLTSLCLLSFGLSSVMAADKLASASSHALSFLAPEGRWAIRLEYRKNGWDKQYDNDSERHELGAVFDQLELNAELFSVLSLLGTSASFGITSFDTRVSNRVFELDIGYGIHEDLTVGILLPFVRSVNSINFSVNAGNVGFNSAFDATQPLGPTNFPFAPVGAGASEPVGTQGLQTILTDPAFGYEYDPIKKSSTSDMADPTFGALWRFYKGDNDSAVAGFGIRFGVAGGDDPDNLVDVPTDDGSTDIRLRMEYYRDLGSQFDLRLFAEHKRQTADHAVLRIPEPGELLATVNSKEKLDRDLGDIWEFDIEVGRSWGDWRSSVTLHRYEKGTNHYSSAQGTDTSALEANTKVFANQWRVSGSWSGINAWRSGSFPLPLILTFETQQTWKARNFPDVRDYYLRATTFF